MENAELKLLQLKAELLSDQLRQYDQLFYKIKEHARKTRELILSKRGNDYSINMTREEAAKVTDYLLALERDNLMPLENCQFLDSVYSQIHHNKTILSKL